MGDSYFFVSAKALKEEKHNNKKGETIMQTKFLRTAAALAIFAVTQLGPWGNVDSRAMDNTEHVKLTVRIKNYRTEADTCSDTWQSRANVDGLKPAFSVKGKFSGLTHSRDEGRFTPSMWAGGDGVIMPDGCSACTTLDLACKAMHRDRKVHDARHFM
jgi:hypothetical protein